VTYDEMNGLPRRCNSLFCGPERATAIYRLYNRDERLLYAGIAYDVEDRWKEHSRDKPWWPDVRWKTAMWHETRLGAAIEEYCAIRYENPIHNKRRDYDYRLGVDATACPGRHEPRDWPFWLLTYAMMSPTAEHQRWSEQPHYAAVISRAGGSTGRRRRIWFPRIPDLGGQEFEPWDLGFYGYGLTPSELVACGFSSHAACLVRDHFGIEEEEFTVSVHHADGCPEPAFASRTPKPRAPKPSPRPPERKLEPALQLSRWGHFKAAFGR
jgi:predicted GIY-YIG superfamily endonuclease